MEGVYDSTELWWHPNSVIYKKNYFFGFCYIRLSYLTSISIPFIEADNFYYNNLASLVQTIH